MSSYVPQKILEDGKFIADVITNSAQWQLGHNVLITASTGTGKSDFIIRYLHQIYLQSGYKSLFLTNRKALQEQLIAKYSDASKWIDFMTYQTLSKRVVHNKAYEHTKYAIIVADEAHYFFADAPFAMHTDRVLHYLLHDCSKTLRIYLSATTNILSSYQDPYSVRCNFVYSYMRPYQFDQCFYWRDYKTIEEFLTQLPPNEKAIFFTQQPHIALQMNKKIPNSTFVCAKGNPRYGKCCDTATLDELINHERFSSQILFTTSVLDNGINIKDNAVKHIIIDLFDYDSIVQCIGRRRTPDVSTLPNIYIRQYRYPTIHTRKIRNLQMLKMVDDFRTLTRYDFCNHYGTKFKGGLIYTLAPSNQVDYYVNTAKEHKLRYDLEVMNDMNRIDTRFGHLKLFCSMNYLDFDSFQDLSYKVTALSLTDKLNRFVGKPLFDTDKDEFKAFMKNDVLCPLEGGYKVNTINAYFEDLGIPFCVDQKKENRRKSDNYGKRYWILTRT